MGWKKIGPKKMTYERQQGPAEWCNAIALSENVHHDPETSRILYENKS